MTRQAVRSRTYVRGIRSTEEYERVAVLIDERHSCSEIARRLGLPASTVREWRSRHRGRLGPPGSTWRRQVFDSLPGEHYAYLLGVYLGDGCISHARRGVFRLRVFLDCKYEGIIQRTALAMSVVMPGRTVSQRWTAGVGKGCVEVYSYSKQWPCLIPPHGPGKKHERRIRLASWQEKIVKRHRRPLVRGLLESDGCRVVANDRGVASPRYHFSNRSEDIKRLYCESLDALGIRWTRPCSKQIAVYRKSSVAVLDEFVGPKR